MGTARSKTKTKKSKKTPTKPWHKRLRGLIGSAKTWKTVGIVALGVYGVYFLIFYPIGRMYQVSHRDQPLKMGVSFSAKYARELGVDPKETYLALVDDVKVKHLRLMSYWSEIEGDRGSYDWRQLDWEMRQAEERGVSVSLALGLRQPRWPECHAPGWVDLNQSKELWQPELMDFIEATVNRYKHYDNLISYQLENEFFLSGFGRCPDMTRDRLIAEYELVKRLDGDRPIIVSRSNNAWGTPAGKPLPDMSAVSIYRRTWETNFKEYIDYPFTSWHYAGMAGWNKLLTGSDTIIHELQTEPWAPRSQRMVDVSLEEQDRSFNPGQFYRTVDFAKRTGLREIYLWGGEYWYYRKVKLDEPEVWRAAKDIYRQANIESESQKANIGR